MNDIFCVGKNTLEVDQYSAWYFKLAMRAFYRREAHPPTLLFYFE